MQADTFAAASSIGSYPTQIGTSSVPLLNPQVLHK